MNHKYNKNISGGIALRVVIAAVSLLVLGGTIVAVLKTFDVSKTEDHRKAQQLSDYGLQAAFIRLAEQRDWNTGFTDEPFDDGASFSVEFSREEKGGVTYVKVTSTGRSGSVTVTQTEEKPLPANNEPEDGNPEASADNEPDDANGEPAADGTSK